MEVKDSRDLRDSMEIKDPRDLRDPLGHQAPKELETSAHVSTKLRQELLAEDPQTPPWTNLV